MVNRLLVLTTVRHLRKQAWQSWLSVLGIALGVAVVVAVDMANESARRAFLLSAESLTGKATHQLSGGSNGISEDIYRWIRIEKKLRSSAPWVEGRAKLSDQRLHLVGVDPLPEV